MATSHDPSPTPCTRCGGPVDQAEAVVYPGCSGAVCGPCVRDGWPVLEAVEATVRERTERGLERLRELAAP